MSGLLSVLAKLDGDEFGKQLDTLYGAYMPGTGRTIPSVLRLVVKKTPNSSILNLEVHG